MHKTKMKMKFTTAIALVILLSSGYLSAHSGSSSTSSQLEKDSSTFSQQSKGNIFPSQLEKENGTSSQREKGSIVPFQLTCEYLVNPTGLDIPH
jgi:hypothetical protein